MSPHRRVPNDAAVRSAVCAAGLALLLATSVRGERLVTVRSTAESSYAEARQTGNALKPQTYVFAKGGYFPGITRDSTLDKMSLDKIVQTLAGDLQKQNYVPASSLATADLILVVHWGVTMGHDRGITELSFALESARDAAGSLDTIRTEDSENLGAIADAATDFRTEARNVGILFAGNDLRASSNAELLGMRGSLERESGLLFETDRSQTLRAMIDEERYFIIIIAYDGPQMREGKRRRLWTSRMSIRAAGVNFKMALDRMSNAGGNSFGTKQAQLAMEYVQDRVGTVKVGELKVIEYPEQAPASSSKAGKK